MSSLLLAESGSTKTDWCLIRGQEAPVCFKTTGINPYLQSEAEIFRLLEEELDWQHDRHLLSGIRFYGAGTGSEANRRQMADVLSRYFGSVQDVEVHCDMMAAARSLCGDREGIVCILGTGSNSCYYDGADILHRHQSLGYIAGDEGSGNYMGKKVLQHYAYRIFDEELLEAFEALFGNDVSGMVRRLYKEPFPNRFLAGLVQLLVRHRGHYMVENIIEDSLHEFFQTHILRYRQSWQSPICFTGSVSWEFRDVIQALCTQYELEPGAIVANPLEGLIDFHRQRMS